MHGKSFRTDAENGGAQWLDLSLVCAGPHLILWKMGPPPPPQSARRPTVVDHPSRADGNACRDGIRKRAQPGPLESTQHFQEGVFAQGMSDDRKRQSFVRQKRTVRRKQHLAPNTLSPFPPSEV